MGKPSPLSAFQRQSVRLCFPRSSRRSREGRRVLYLSLCPGNVMAVIPVDNRAITGSSSWQLHPIPWIPESKKRAGGLELGAPWARFPPGPAGKVQLEASRGRDVREKPGKIKISCRESERSGSAVRRGRCHRGEHCPGHQMLLEPPGWAGQEAAHTEPLWAGSRS